MLCVVVAVGQGMVDEWKDPQKEIHDRIDEEQPQLSLYGLAAALHGS